MSQVLQKFIPRAPRYVLRPGDSEVLRFAPNGSNNQTHQTKIINLSQTGIAFLVETPQSPKIGDLIKIEFAIPASEQVAWWAKVVRIEAASQSRWWDQRDETNSPSHVVVAVTYVEMPDGHRREIQKGLNQRYKQLRKQYYTEWLVDFSFFIKRNFWNFVLFGLCSVAAILAIVLFTHYEPLFDRKNGSVYFEMFEGLDF